MSQRSNYRWFINFLLFSITMINYIDRASIAYAIDLIAKDFQLNTKQMGLVLGAFGVGYAVTTILGGLAADYYGAKKTFGLSILLWAIAALFIAGSTGFMVLLGARVLLGLAEGPNFPALTRAISDWLSIKERTRALSFALLSVPASLALCGPVMSQLIVALGWRGGLFYFSRDCLSVDSLMVMVF